MDINGISTSLNAKGLLSAPDRIDLPAPDKAQSEVPRKQDHGVYARRGLALGILKQELSMRAWIRARLSTSFAEPRPTAETIAEDALAAAKQIVAESPSTARESLVSFRSRVEQATSYAREAIGADDDADEIDEVVAKVDEGLGELEDDVAGYRESSASVLAVDTRTKQRSTIRILTQEGDVVRLSLRRADSLSATDVAYSDGNVSVSATEVAVSSRSRMMLSVKGDLNEAEFEAIRNVFAQAEAIADEFFGGDIGAAFGVARGFEFDTEQLARVNMRFRMREISTVAYAETVRTLPAAARQDPRFLGPPEVADPIEPRPYDEAPEPFPYDEAPILPVPGTEPSDVIDVELPTPAPVQPAPVDKPATSAFESFFETLNAFLRSISEGFQSELSGSSLRYHYSESFKLEMLGAVLHTLAGAEEMHGGEDTLAAEAGVSADRASEMSL